MPALPVNDAFRAAYRKDIAEVQGQVLSGNAMLTDKDEIGYSLLLTAASTMRENQDSAAPVRTGPREAFNSANISKSIQLVIWLMHIGANIDDAVNGKKIWHLINFNLKSHELELSTLLNVMVLLGDAPLRFEIRLNSTLHYQIVTDGYNLRERMPLYLKQRQALLVTHCPLIAELQSIVADYFELTHDDIWDRQLQLRNRIKRVRDSPSVTEFK
jgi:hypothetical protein